MTDPHEDRTSRAGETADLARQAARGSADAWAALVAKVESRLRVLAAFRLSARARAQIDPEDVCQETLAEAVRRIDRFEDRGPGGLQRWLAGILRNKVLHAERAARRSANVVVTLGLHAAPDATPGAHAGLREALLAACTPPSGAARRREREEAVRRALAELPRAEREVVLLKHYEGLGGREVAARLGVDERTVTARYRRALARIAHRLRERAYRTSRPAGS